MAGFTAVLDACVLFPAPLRDLLISLAAGGLYRAKWSQHIHDEWTQSLIAKRPELDPQRLQNTCTRMNVSVPDSLVVGYESLIDSLTLSDPDDRHVLAVAIRCDADAIITFNSRDFDDAELAKYDVYTEHPDEFVSNMLTLNTPDSISIVREMRARLTNPPISVSQFLQTLQKQGLPQSVGKLSKFSGSL